MKASRIQKILDASYGFNRITSLEGIHVSKTIGIICVCGGFSMVLIVSLWFRSRCLVS